MRELTLHETRVIGALIEKQVTTPDQYPLSLNSLTAACNQKSNREPVLNMSESDVQETLDALQELGVVTEMRIGARVAKYKHRFCNTEFSKMHLPPPELAIICLLLLRGPQTPGELRSRSGRLFEFKSVDQVESCLQELIERDTPLVCKLPREPGRRESRYMHLFSGEPDLEALQSAESTRVERNSVGSGHESRITTLEEQVVQMQEEIAMLKKQWDELNN